jgi:hypothetical protein
VSTLVLFLESRCMGIDSGCCIDSNPCGEGDGDCDRSSECKGDLVCGHDNCPHFADDDDCCTGNQVNKISEKK